MRGWVCKNAPGIECLPEACLLVAGLASLGPTLKLAD